ncbi:hypothetical protein [Chitinophaga sp. HK235]|uniref:hypothetical protein n=1 Tax=Chitinophaga sp. HK235 TaxID=2952571 RepID=UPI001BA58E7F|nr:hypothetical protein [Chitinophaga sp. HK235]
MKKILSGLISRGGYQLIRRTNVDLIQDYYNMYHSDNTQLSEGNTIVIFSKDRVLQLHALLYSLFSCVSDYQNIVVLYNASDEAYMKSYRELEKEIGNRAVFIKENVFESDLKKLLRGITTDQVLFLVDDIVFLDKVALAPLRALVNNGVIVSLRLGSNIAYSYTGQAAIPLPSSLKEQGDMIDWYWKDGLFDWGYPLSVDGNIFKTKEIRAMMETISFKAPNTLELNLQVFNVLFGKRRGLAYQTSRLVNNPCNRVQNEIQNKSGNISAEYLHSVWQKGMRIDFKKMYKYVPKSPHEELPIDFITENHLCNDKGN